MKITRALIILVGAILACPVAGLAGGVVGGAEPHADGACANPGESISIAVGNPMSKLRSSDSSEVRALASLASVGPPSYVIKPKVINYAGAVKFDVSCPRLVSITSKNDRVDSLVVDFAAGDPSSLGLSLALASYWRGKFAGMNLDQGPADLRAYVVSIDVARKEFNLIHPSWGGVFGNALGVWRKGSEVFGLGIECWNVSSLGEPGRFIYIVQITVSNASN